MSRLRKTILNVLQEIGDNSGCHQMPERSFFINGWQFPVCARCTGVALGQALAVLVGFFFKPISALLSFLLLAAMGTDWGLQEINIMKSTNIRRFFTGIMGGYGLFNLYVLLFKKIIHKRKI